jgi:HD-GYP domain-containing protein (c-di-GMP phosphodiesterase class II)
MKKILAADLKEGQTFSNPVYIDDNSIFIPQDTPILKKDLELLTVLGITELLTEDSPPAPKAANTAAPVFQQGEFVSPDVSTSVSKLINYLNSIFAAIKSKRQINIRLLWHITDSLTTVVKTYRDDALKLILCGDTRTGLEMAKNSVDTAILSAVMGEELKFPSNKTRELVAAALLHDVGMLRLPETIVKKEGALSDRELAIMQSHTLHSFNIIKKELMYPDSVCAIALQHHEHWDGNGYPSHISENKINDSALIVAVVDSFVAMMNKKTYRNTMTGYQAMKTLLSENGVCFSPAILKLFVKIMGVYPIGSGVLLNDNSIAMVTKVNAEFPLRPVVQALVDKTGGAVKTGGKINLLIDKKLFITCAVDIKRFRA